VKDFARVAQLSAEEAFRLLLSKHKDDEQNVWARFEAELTKRTADIAQRHRDELHTLTARTKELETAARTIEQQKAHEIEHINRRVEDSLRQVAELQQRNQELESQMSKVARRGKLEELSFEDEVQTWPGMCVSEKLPKNGDYLLAYRDPSGAVLEPRLLIDNKDKAAITEGDIKKLIRDAKERHIPIGVIAAKDETQLRQVDRDCRWSQEDGIWVLRTTRSWLRRDLGRL
jgi:predicted RNase H-like nuclease (RuvC/YqgF family)